MLDRLRQYEGEDQVALFGTPSESLLTRFISMLRQVIQRYRTNPLG